MQKLFFYDKIIKDILYCRNCKKLYGKTMETSELTLIQQEICKALTQLQNKSLITEAIIAKKIRENTNFSGKNKAGLSLNDMETALEHLEKEENLFFSVHCNSANDVFFRKEDSPKPLELAARQRRLKSEKNITILTSNDLKSPHTDKHKSKSSKNPKRTERKSLNIYGDYDE